MKYRVIALLLTLAVLFSIIPAALAAEPTKLVALTFDDGPGPYTQRLLDGLAKYQAKATFFCLGSRVEAYPETVKRIVEEGHQLANHSYDHPNLNELSAETAAYQFTRTDACLNAVVGGTEAYYCRAPYGNSNEALRSLMQAPLIGWSVDTLDWMVRNTQKVKENILRDTFDGAIVLLHDIHEFSVDGVLAAMDTLVERGYEFVTVKELLQRRGVTPQAGQVYNICKPNGTSALQLKKPEMTVNRAAEAIEVSFQSEDGVSVFYTLDGSAIGTGSILYEEPFTVILPCTIRAVAALDLNGYRSEELSATYTLPPAGEPQVSADKNGLMFTPANREEQVFYVLDDGTEREAEGRVRLPGSTWFSYYADGEGLTPTEPKRYLYTEEGNLFTDVDPSQWYYSALDHAAAEGWMQGSGDGMMQPEQIVTRGMLAVLLWRMEGSPSAKAEVVFTDVDPDAYYAEAVAWCCENGIFDGVGNGCFAPNQPITRQQLAKVLLSWLQPEEVVPSEEPVVVYEDAQSIAPWAVESVDRISALGIMEGSNGCFRPTQTANRAQIATVLVRVQDMK